MRQETLGSVTGWAVQSLRGIPLLEISAGPECRRLQECDHKAVPRTAAECTVSRAGLKALMTPWGSAMETTRAKRVLAATGQNGRHTDRESERAPPQRA